MSVYVYVYVCVCVLVCQCLSVLIYRLNVVHGGLCESHLYIYLSI
jgi:hypothetical protein